MILTMLLMLEHDEKGYHVKATAITLTGLEEEKRVIEKLVDWLRQINIESALGRVEPLKLS